MWEGPADELNETSIHSRRCTFIRLRRGGHSRFFTTERPVTVAGHSLGELSALTASGALTFADGLKLVRTRGELMKRAGELNPGGMAAILGADIPTLDRICAEASTADEVVQVANDNCPGQVVISGHKPALERAMAAAKTAGAKRALSLPVSIAAHSPLMDSIQAEWNAAVDACLMEKPEIPVVGNVHARSMLSADELRADIKAQMQSRVRWTELVQYMLGKRNPDLRRSRKRGSPAGFDQAHRRVHESISARQPTKLFCARRLNRLYFDYDRYQCTNQKYVGEMAGNEALLQMLDTDAAAELLNWGIATVTSLVQKQPTWMMLPRSSHWRHSSRLFGRPCVRRATGRRETIPIRLAGPNCAETGRKP